MQDIPKKDFRQELGAFFARHLFKAEMAGLALAVAGALMLAGGQASGKVIMGIPLVVLAIAHFFCAFELSEEIRDKPMLGFMRKLSGWGISILLLALLYQIFSFPGNDVMYIVGLNTLMIMLFLSFILQMRMRKTHGLLNDFHRPLQIRVAIYALLAFLLRYAFSGNGIFTIS